MQGEQRLGKHLPPEDSRLLARFLQILLVTSILGQLLIQLQPACLIPLGRKERFSIKDIRTQIHIVFGMPPMREGRRVYELSDQLSQLSGREFLQLLTEPF